MRCPECGAPAIAFAVPSPLGEHAPAKRSAICSRCLRTFAADAVDAADPADADFSTIHDSFPSGRAGVAFALALGKLGSLALERRSIESLCEAAEREGADVRLALERLAEAEGLAPHFDVARRTEQLAAFR